MKSRISSGIVAPGLVLNHASREPILAQIAQHYRKQISEGAFVEGQRLPTCKELANALGLANQTVNRAFDLLAKEGLVHRRRSLGTVVGHPPLHASPSEDAPRHRPATPPICMVMRKVDHAYQEWDLTADYLTGLMEGFNAWKCRFEIAHLLPDQPDLDLVRTLVERRQVRGLVNLNLAPEATEYLIEKRFPMVLLSDDFSARGVASVVADHVRGYSEGWRHALEAGHRRIVFFGYDDQNQARRFRECVAGGKLTEGGGELMKTILAPNHADSVSIAKALRQELGPWDGSKWPTLFFVQTDLIASRLIRALQEMQVRVPQQVSVIGFNNSSIAGQFNPTITTLSKPRVKMALAASQLLLDILAKRPGSADRLQVFTVAWVQRETFAPFVK